MIEIKARNIDELIEADYNPRWISEDDFNQLKKSLERFNAVDPAIINMHKERENTIIGGHQRLRAAKALGWQTFPCVEVDLTYEKERELNVRLNKNTGAFDFDLLANNFEAFDLIDWGFTDEELFGEDDDIKSEDDDHDPGVVDDIETDIVLGDLIEIGNHRVLCGDSTKSEDVDKLLAGEKPLLMVTDPPYGVRYDADWRNQRVRSDGNPIGGRAVGKVANDDVADWTDAWNISPSIVAYVWHASLHTGIVQKSLQDSGFEIINQIIWNKSNFAIGRGDYHWKHEPCWYAVKKGNKHHFTAGRDQSTVWDIPKPTKSETGHSTQKHLDCMFIPIKNHEGDVYDPFLGSGTTLLACEQLGRQCYGIEIDPKYCQVIINRMKEYDPKITVKVNGKKI